MGEGEVWEIPLALEVRNMRRIETTMVLIVVGALKVVSKRFGWVCQMCWGIVDCYS